MVEPIAARPPVAQRLHPAAIAGPQPIALAVSGETGTHLSRASEPAVVSLAPPAAAVVSAAPPPAGELVAPAPATRRAMVAPPAADPDDSFAPRVRSASALPTMSRRRVGWGWWIALAAAAAFFAASAATWMR